MISTIARRRARRTLAAFLSGTLLLVFSLPAFGSAASAEPAGGSLLFAQASEPEDRDLEPRYKGREPKQGTDNPSYLFGLSRALAKSTVHPAVKAPIFVVTIPLDLAFAPFALLGGLFR